MEIIKEFQKICHPMETKPSQIQSVDTIDSLNCFKVYCIFLILYYFFTAEIAVKELAIKGCSSRSDGSNERQVYTFGCYNFSRQACNWFPYSSYNVWNHFIVLVPKFWSWNISEL